MIPLVNYWAVLVSALAVMVVSFVWYGPLFGKTWMRLSGMDKATPEEMAAGRKKMLVSTLIQFIAALVMAFVLARAIALGGAAENIPGIAAGIHFAFWNWLGFVVPVTLGTVLWEGKPWRLWFIIAGNWLVNLVVIGVIIGWWV